MKLSVVIVNWNSRDYLRSCLESLYRSCIGLNVQVIVVDGGSYDGCAEMVAQEFPEVEMIQSPENIGFGRANNLGFEHAIGEYLLLLNPDTELMPGAVDVLLTNLRELPGAGVVGARLLNADGSLQMSSVHRLPTPWNVAVDSNWCRRRWWRRHGPGQHDFNAREVEAVSGACMMMRAETFRQLHGFDPCYFMYAEDMDLCLRVRRADMRIYHAPRAQVVHHGGACAQSQISKFAAVMIRQAVYTYFRRNFGRGSAARYRLLIGLSAILRLGLLVVVWFSACGSVRAARRASIAKWWNVLRWSAGLEGWSKRRFENPSRQPELSPSAG